VPAENGVEREAGSDFAEDLPTDRLAFDRQASPLVVTAPDPSLAVGFLQDLVFGPEVLDDSLRA
jgi:hypothetical protein